MEYFKRITKFIIPFDAHPDAPRTQNTTFGLQESSKPGIYYKLVECNNAEYQGTTYAILITPDRQKWKSALRGSDITTWDRFRNKRKDSETMTAFQKIEPYYQSQNPLNLPHEDMNIWFYPKNNTDLYMHIAGEIPEDYISFVKIEEGDSILQKHPTIMNSCADGTPQQNATILRCIERLSGLM
jgi:hypothetical protein